MKINSLSYPKLGKWRFLQLSVLIAIWMLIAPLVADRLLIQVFVQVFLINTILVTVSTTGNWRRNAWILVSLWCVSVAASVIGQSQSAPDLRELFLEVEFGMRILIIAFCAISILSFVFRQHAVTLDGFFAALATYLLIAFAFAQLYVLLLMWSPASFQMPGPPPTNIEPDLVSAMLYFSFVTIATLGYGDVVPLTEPARMIAMIEAVIGQFYVAVIVAMLVTRFVSRSSAPG